MFSDTHQHRKSIVKGLIFLTILTIQTFNLHTPPRGFWLHTGPKPRAKPTTTGRRIWPCSPAEAGWAGAVIAVSCTKRLTLVPARARSTGGTPWSGGLLASQHSHHPPTTLQSSLSSSHHGRVQTEGPKISQTAVGAASQPTTAATKGSETIPKSGRTIILPIPVFGFSVRDVNADALDDEVLSAERLSNLQQRHRSGLGAPGAAWGKTCALEYLIICKCDKSKSPERLGDENIRDFPILHKELPQVICGHIFRATAHKHFPTPQGLV